jgi:hypothetical protein
MTRRPAIVTQADVARAIRAAQQTGAGQVRIQPDGTILIDLQPESLGEKPKRPVARGERPVL